MNRRVLPIPVSPDRPEAAVDYREQEPPFQVPPDVRPPEGAPNVLLVLFDDMGFGASSAYGGPCEMPM